MKSTRVFHWLPFSLAAGFLSLTVSTPAAGPTVSNVRAAQRAGTQLVDVYYDLADPDSSTLTVSVAVSTNGGAAYFSPGASVSGALGTGIAPDSNKKITWNAGVDLPAKLFSNVRVSVTASDDTGPSGMALIPAGSFTMGDTFNEGTTNELPTHMVQVSGFYMDKTEVTKALWDEVRTWALAHGFTFGSSASGKGTNHPVQTVSWYDAVKWCNARSEKEGRVPAYYTDAAQTGVYRTGWVGVQNMQNDWVKWNAGYRLPTEAEWEKAARGGLSGKRFPWGDTISHSQANYSSGTNYTYDTSPTRGYHPTFNDGVYPYTSPVCSFAPNGYGLYDMAGNVWEWCWDRWGSYSSGSQTDPRGPTLDRHRRLRGGSWGHNAFYCRVADRSATDWPDNTGYDPGTYGFRSVLPPGEAGGIHSAQSNIMSVDTRDNLAVESVRCAQSSVNAGQNVTVSFRVRNLLAANASATKARLRLTTVGVLTDSGPGLVPLEVDIPALSSGGSYDYSGNFTVPANLLPGTYYIGVKLVPVAPGTEINPANSVGLSASKLTVPGTGGPSLQVTPASRDVVSRAGLVGLLIRNIAGGTFSWSASIPDAPWLHFTSVNSGVVEPNGTTLILRFDVNPSTSPRTGHVLVSGPGASPASQEVAVIQAGSVPPGPAVTHFEFSTTASPQPVNAAFTVTITAMNGVVVQTAFTGRATLSSEAGGSAGWDYVDFSNGQWTGQLSLNTPCAQTRLLADGSKYGTAAEGQSNPFAVVAANSDVKITVKVQTQAGAAVSGAAVSLQRTGESPVARVSDSQGQAEFTVVGGAERGSYLLLVEKSGFITHTDTVDIAATPKLFKVQLKPLGKPPVVLVPGIMGSCVGSKMVRVLDPPFLTIVPILPGPLLSPLSGKYADPGDLKLFNPDPWVVGEIVGWEKLRDSLSANYAVYEAPWDWRMPVIRPDGPYVAWREYLKPIITWAKQATGYPTVDVVAHSMGGILVRAYIASGEYDGDIGTFAMVGTPNEGSAKAYHLWFGGNPSVDSFYEKTSEFNYEIWESPNKWDNAAPEERMSFYHKWTKSLEELLPVYAYAISCGGDPAMPYPGHTANPLYQLDTGSFAEYDKLCATPGKVCAKIFCSTDESTLETIKLQKMAWWYDSSVYPDGRPKGATYDRGDGTVLNTSAWMKSFEIPFGAVEFPAGGKHAGLIGELSPQIASFLTGLPIQPAGGGRGPKGPEPGSGSASNHLAISVLGRDRLWVIDPDSTGAGISPITDAFTNGWPSTTADVGAYGSALDRDDAPGGLYQGTIKGFPGEMLSLDVQFFRSSQAFLTNASWIVTTNDITFDIQLNPTDSNPLNLLVAAPAPVNVASFLSNGTCHVSWSNAPGSVAGFRIYARREDESLFQPLGTTTNRSYDTGYAWEQGKTGTNWFFAVVAVTTNNAEGPYTDVVMNAAPVKAAFAADVRSGAPPLTVTFTNQSLGSVTNWAWDFDGDGNIDSVGEDPSIVFAETGSYTVTLTVSGPDGSDTRVAVGYINVSKPELSAIVLKPDWTIELVLSAQSGRNYEIQVSTNLTTWTTLTNLTTTNDTTIFTDAFATNFNQRFYRAVIP